MGPRLGIFHRLTAACCRESGPLVSLLLLFSELAPDDPGVQLPGRRQDVPMISAVPEAERGGSPTSQQLWKEEQQRSLASEAGSVAHGGRERWRAGRVRSAFSRTWALRGGSRACG